MEKEYQKSDVIVTLEHAAKVCFVLQQNNFEIIRSLSVLNNGGKDFGELRLKVSSSPQIFEDAYFSLPALKAGTEHFFKDVKIAPDFEYLSALEERVK